MRNVEIDDEVFEALQRLAEPLVDDINSVLRRLLDLADGDPTQIAQQRLSVSESRMSGRSKPKRSSKTKRSSKAKRAPKGSLLPEEAYKLPILEALEDAGGRAPTSEVVTAVGERLGVDLGDIDRELIGSGEVRWKNRVQFVRLKLIESGLMESDSPRGIWAITDAGRRYVKEAK